jgi:hypothetical protein
MAERATEGAAASWSAAGSAAPRRFGFLRRSAPEVGVFTTVGRRSKAPSPLRFAGAVQDATALPKPLGFFLLA